MRCFEEVVILALLLAEYTRTATDLPANTIDIYVHVSSINYVGGYKTKQSHSKVLTDMYKKGSSEQLLTLLAKSYHPTH